MPSPNPATSSSRNLIQSLVAVGIYIAAAPTLAQADEEASQPAHQTIASPSGSVTAQIPDPSSAPEDLAYHIVFRRNGEVFFKHPIIHTGTADMSAYWSPDEELAAVGTYPYPRHYEVFVFDLKKQKIIFSLENNIATTWEQAAISYFKIRAPDKCAGMDGLNILLYPVKWKDNRTLQVTFSLLGWNEGSAVLPLGCSASSDARLNNGVWKLGPFYDYQEEPVTD